MEKLNELTSLQHQVKKMRLQEKPGKRNFHDDKIKVFETVSETFKIASEDVTEIMMATSEENNKAITGINDKFLEVKIFSGILPSYMLSLLCKNTIPEHTFHFKTKTDPKSNRLNIL